MHPLKFLSAILFTLSLTTSAFAQTKAVVIENAWVRLHGDAVTAYFTIANNAEQADRLLGVSSAAADKVELLRTRVRSGKYTYQPVPALDIGGFGDERLRPGGLFLRLTGVRRRLAVGDTVPLTLRFERAGTIEVAARVSNQLLGNR